MTIRPAFWYALVLTLLLAALVGTLGNVERARLAAESRQAAALPPQGEVVSGRFDSSEFLQDLAMKAANLSVQVERYGLADGVITLECSGEAEDLGALLDWLDGLGYVQKIQRFSLTEQENLAFGENSMGMIAEIRLG